ncbi:lipoate--protein ligase family protein [Microaerobacter geothermalis]|uniref:lipoate--protein ligase family protein n=1 Tax=Microaerobacter geothermalis TaxID=674972 RepID=UPI001F323E54|nr:biotin/lipoate A/B protein ligase family protein [Microaerobacter geothermalis]MCF6094195.1 lipoate--protein ligase family protein [Microaerobacter geothermalis]
MENHSARETWRFINSGRRSPEMNMALDEAMILLHQQGKIPPTIRFYTWEPATLSIGYFQKAEKEVNLAKVKEYGLGFVRRPTGGRAVLHDKELTYSVVVSEEHPMMPRSVTEAYRVLSLGLLEGFKKLGLNAEMVSLASEEEKKKYASVGSAACFDSPSWYELVVEGRKVAGSAQTRQKGVILQHGSILLDMDVNLLFDVLQFPSDRVKERMKKGFMEKAVTINQLSPKPVTIEEAITAFRHGFSKGLNVDLVEGILTDEEESLALQLVKGRYGTADWNLKR